MMRRCFEELAAQLDDACLCNRRRPALVGTGNDIAAAEFAGHDGLADRQ